MKISDLKTLIEAYDCCCPFGFVYVMNRDKRAYSNCQGERCMMWRWGPMPSPRSNRLVVEENYDPNAAGYFEDDFEDPSRPEGAPENAYFSCDSDGMTAFWTWPESEMEITTRRQGWCGLAGRPEKD